MGTSLTSENRYLFHFFFSDAGTGQVPSVEKCRSQLCAGREEGTVEAGVDVQR